MSSILTNSSAMNALSTLRGINNSLGTTQDRISTGLKVASSKDNSAYFSISKTMTGDSSMYKAIDEALTLTKNSVSTARLGAETIVDLSKEFTERLAFAHGSEATSETIANVKSELQDIVARIDTTIEQSSFNGKSLVAGTATETVTTGITRDTAGVVTTTSFTFDQQDLTALSASLKGIADNLDTTGVTDVELGAAEGGLDSAITAANTFGVAEKSIETQQDFLSALTDRIDDGIGSMIDADMEQEAARLQSLQVQQQLATQSLSIANQAPQNILSLFR